MDLGKAEIVIWPDADAPGRKAARHVAGLLPGSRLVVPPEGLPKGGDVVDAIAAGMDVKALVEGVRPAGKALAAAPAGGDGENGAARLTNAAAARFLAGEWRGALVFAEHLGSWMERRRGVWRRCGNAPYTLAAVRGKLTAWAAKVDPEKWWKAESASFIRSSWELVEGEPGMSLLAGEFNRNGNLPTPTGHIAVKTGEWRADPDGNHTMSVTVDPDPDRSIPNWEATVRKVTQGDGEFAGYLQRLAGLLLTEDKSNHTIYWVHGPGRNGKTTFFETLLHIMGDYAALRPAGDLTLRHGDDKRFAAGLEHRRVLVVSELGSGKWNTGVMKQLTGGESMAARLLYKETSKFDPKLKLGVYRNDEPAMPKGHFDVLLVIAE